MMSAPAAAKDRAFRTAASTSPLRPSPENESGVTLTMPMTNVRLPQRNSRPRIVSGSNANGRALRTRVAPIGDVSREPLAQAGDEERGTGDDDELVRARHAPCDRQRFDRIVDRASADPRRLGGEREPVRKHRRSM